MLHHLYLSLKMLTVSTLKWSTLTDKLNLPQLKVHDSRVCQNFKTVSYLNHENLKRIYLPNLIFFNNT